MQLCVDTTDLPVTAACLGSLNGDDESAGKMGMMGGETALKEFCVPLSAPCPAKCGNPSDIICTLPGSAAVPPSEW